MRFRIIFCGLVFIVVLYLLALRILDFVQLFFEHAGVALTQDEIALAHNTTTPDTRPQLIPKIIHQVYHDWNKTGMPQDWEELRQSCIKQSEDWKYMLWNETTSREFLALKFPWFLKTYDGYRYPVQRVDAVRYFLMRHFGGIYLDLDNGCVQPLEPLLYYSSWTTDGGRGALSNNILGARPNHPFWRLLTNSLHDYDYDYFFPYITISYASGQWFETAIWEIYQAMLPPTELQRDENRMFRIMMDDREGSDPWVFFNQKRGGTWVNWDNKMFLWIGDHLILLAIGIFVLGAMLGYRCMTRYSTGYMRMRWYNKVKQDRHAEQVNKEE